MIKYLATAHYDDFDISCETCDMDDLMKFLNDYDEVHQDVINASTGELLYDGNNSFGKDFIEDKFMDAIMDWIYDGALIPVSKSLFRATWKSVNNLVQICKFRFKSPSGLFFLALRARSSRRVFRICTISPKNLIKIW